MLLIIGTLDILGMKSIEAYRTSIGRFYNRLRHFTNAQSVLSIRCKDVFTIFICFLFPLLHLPVLLYAFFAIFVLVTFDVLCLKSVRLNYIDCFFHFLEYNYRELNLNFLKLAHLLIDGDVESNPGPTQNDCNSPR